MKPGTKVFIGSSTGTVVRELRPDVYAVRIEGENMARIANRDEFSRSTERAKALLKADPRAFPRIGHSSHNMTADKRDEWLEKIKATASARMAHMDALSFEERRLIHEHGSIFDPVERRKQTLFIYGPDHPQAKTENDLLLEELGL